MPSYAELSSSLVKHRRPLNRSSKFFLGATLLFIIVSTFWPVSLAAYLTLILGGMGLSLGLKLLSDLPANKLRALFYLSAVLLGLSIGAWLLLSLPTAGMVVVGAVSAWKLLALPSLGFVIFCTSGYSAASDYLRRPQSKLREDVLTPLSKILHTAFILMSLILAVGFSLLATQVFPIALITPITISLVVTTLSMGFMGWLLIDAEDSHQLIPPVAQEQILIDGDGDRRSIAMTPINGAQKAHVYEAVLTEEDKDTEVVVPTQKP